MRTSIARLPLTRLPRAALVLEILLGIGALGGGTGTDDPTTDDESTFGPFGTYRRSLPLASVGVMNPFPAPSTRISRLLAATLLAVALASAACGSSGTSQQGSASAPVAAMPAGYVSHSGAGFTLGMSPDWHVANDPGNVALLSTNTAEGHRWMLIVDRDADAKPVGQSYEDWVATQRAKCVTPTTPDTLTVAAGPAYVCRVDGGGLAALDYRVPAGGDVWHLTLAFQDGKYSGAGQTEAEAILQTLALTK